MSDHGPDPHTARVALISGGNRGIGYACAQALAALGIHVVIGSRDADHGAAAVERLRTDGLRADTVPLDVTDPQSCADAVQVTQALGGRLDVLINNAGIALDQWVPTQALDLDSLRRTMETNVYGELSLAQHALPIMRAQGYGRIVNVSSELGSLGESQLGSSAAYRMSKTALNMMTRLLALELKNEPNILINAGAPGWVQTDLGGPDATRTPAQGAKTLVWLATLPAGGPSGGFFRDEAPYPW